MSISSKIFSPVVASIFNFALLNCTRRSSVSDESECGSLWPARSDGIASSLLSSRIDRLFCGDVTGVPVAVDAGLVVSIDCDVVYDSFESFRFNELRIGLRAAFGNGWLRWAMCRNKSNRKPNYTTTQMMNECFFFLLFSPINGKYWEMRRQKSHITRFLVTPKRMLTSHSAFQHRQYSIKIDIKANTTTVNLLLAHAVMIM